MKQEVGRRMGGNKEGQRCARPCIAEQQKIRTQHIVLTGAEMRFELCWVRRMCAMAGL